VPLAAIARELAIHVGAGYSVVNFFSYFTNLANLFAAGVLLRDVDLGALRPWINVLLPM
jgi:hypothetical protein